MSKEEKTPNCQKKRTFFNLFEVFTCENCPCIKEDEEYVVGENKLYIYHLDNGCIMNDGLTKDDLVNSKKMRAFLKDAVINQNDILILWLDSFDVDKRDNDFYSLMSFGLDVHIMTF